ncbi:hypothetical protein U0070_018710, partial [Myodes glareolus]
MKKDSILDLILPLDSAQDRSMEDEVTHIQPGVGTGDAEGQLCCSFYDGFSVLGGNIVSNLSTVRFVAHQQHLQLLDVVDQKLPEATRQ